MEKNRSKKNTQRSGAQKRKTKKEKEEAIKEAIIEEAVEELERLKLGPTALWTGWWCIIRMCLSRMSCRN